MMAPQHAETLAETLTNMHLKYFYDVNLSLKKSFCILHVYLLSFILMWATNLRQIKSNSAHFTSLYLFYYFVV